MRTFLACLAALAGADAFVAPRAAARAEHELARPRGDGHAPHTVRSAFGKKQPAPTQEEEETKFDLGTLSMRDKVSAYNRPAEDSALLSESWKTKEAPGDVEEGETIGLPFGLLGGLGLAVGLVAFSFVPVGEQTVGIPANDPTKVPVTNFVKVLD